MHCGIKHVTIVEIHILILAYECVSKKIQNIYFKYEFRTSDLLQASFAGKILIK